MSLVLVRLDLLFYVDCISRDVIPIMKLVIWFLFLHKYFLLLISFHPSDLMISAVFMPFLGPALELQRLVFGISFVYFDVDGLYPSESSVASSWHSLYFC